MAGDDPAVARAAAIAAMGLQASPDDAGVDAAAGRATGDADPRVRAAALAALVRAGSSAAAMRAWADSMGDVAPAVRRRAAELTPALAARTAPAALATALVGALTDPDPTVVEAVAWALGELADAAVAAGATTALSTTATTHDDPLAREAAVAALGALGDPAGLDAILRACRDKPAVRRRAVLALAPFEGEQVDAALHEALEDRDWQVRQAAEDLLA